MAKKYHLVWFFALLSLFTVGMYTASAESADVPMEMDGIEDTPTTGTPVTHTVQETQQVVIELKGDPGEAEIDEIESLGADISLKHDNLVQAEIDTNNRSSYSSLPWVKEVRNPYRPFPSDVGGEGAEVIGAQTAHEAGVTGKNTTVAVIDLGFNTDNQRISDNVVEYKSFGNPDIEGIDPKHGTSSAEVVLDVAPEADLYLATVATDVGYANAMSWVEKKDVDVVTASLGFYGQPNDGTGFVSQESDEIVNTTDAVFTVSTGNSGESHWEGKFSDGDGDGLHEFETNKEINYLNSNDGSLGNKLPAGVDVSLHLTWDDWGNVDSSYDISVVRSERDGSKPTKVNADVSNPGGPSKYLSFTTPSEGFYGVTVEKTGGDSDELELFARTTPDKYSTFLHRVYNGSIVSPAVAEETLGVGAFRYNQNTLAPYSSRGPTNDGRQGVTFAAPTCATTSAYNGDTYCGTSGAAPHGAGVAALLRSARDLNSTRVENSIINTADPMPGDSYDVGAGALNASAAVGTVLENTDDTDEGTHESGVSQELWDAVTGDGNLQLGDIGTAIIEYQEDKKINGVSISLGDLGNLILYYQS